MCMREWKRVIEKEKEEKERRGVARRIWEGWIKWKKNKVQGGRIVERRNFHSFSNHVQSDNEDVIGAS
jgi:hypothetical protein